MCANLLFICLAMCNSLVTTNCSSHLRMVHKMFSSGAKKTSRQAPPCSPGPGPGPGPGPLPIFDHGNFVTPGGPASAAGEDPAGPDWFEALTGGDGGNICGGGDKSSSIIGFNDSPGSYISSSSSDSSSCFAPIRPHPKLAGNRSLSFS
jgi:hypothetical protein